MLIDTHCHLDFHSFDADRDEVIRRAAQAGVQRIIVPAIDLHNIATLLALADRYKAVTAAVGVHPNSTADWQDSWLGDIRASANHPQVVAIGEIGLDYYRDYSPREIQRVAFSSQLELAASLALPVIIHNRDAGKDIIRLLAESSLADSPRPGVLHSFSDAWPVAEAALEMGFHIGITGPVTFKNADDLRQIVARLPLDRILVETDAPFLAPHPYRGKRNEPAYVTYMADQIAALHEVSAQEVAAITTTNARQLFRLADQEDRDRNV